MWGNATTWKEKVLELTIDLLEIIYQRSFVTEDQNIATIAWYMGKIVNKETVIIL
jgi:hypothetical protein